MSTKEFADETTWPLCAQIGALLDDHARSIARHKAQRFALAARPADPPPVATDDDGQPFASDDDRRAYVQRIVAEMCAAEGRPAPPPPLAAPPGLALAFRAVTPPMRDDVRASWGEDDGLSPTEQRAHALWTADPPAPPATAAALDAALTAHVQAHATTRGLSFGGAVRELAQRDDAAYRQLRAQHYAAWSREVSR